MKSLESLWVERECVWIQGTIEREKRELSKMLVVEKKDKECYL